MLGFLSRLFSFARRRKALQLTHPLEDIKMNEAVAVPRRNLHIIGFVKRLNQLSMDKLSLLNDVISRTSGNVLNDETAFSIQEDAFEQFLILDQTMNKLVRDLLVGSLQVQNPPVVHDQSVTERVQTAQEDRHGNQGDNVPTGNH
jgi:hypothetical protein